MGPAACCDHVCIYTRDDTHTHREYCTDFYMEKTKSGTPITCNEAALFKNKEKTLYLYRTKEGDWVTGKIQLGKIGKSPALRSQDPQRTSFIQECPCQTEVWQKMVGKNWVTDSELRVIIRAPRVVITME
ncbi:uncharacterized protein LOC111713740 [Eurytemora carolleeae]|uniref:uncharacterized protein LOC111713740 n=1 Tax=Eurytemora carolleeae TaxID=1294199 RepID=UPI000C77E7C6|nr:uncharacterized protein LOC111713740 [Eurytemora carolleeae]|eukprot:XP_023344448.1 uncharacterized protein LOC111713740 [Eurytemora affinis]